MKRLIYLLLALLLPVSALAEGMTLVPAAIEGLPEGSCVIGTAPAGNVVLCVADGAMCLLRDGQIIPVSVSETRGAEDTYKNLMRMAENHRPIGSEGIAWSPDGRYVTFTNYRVVVQTASFHYDPMVIDTATGEMFLLATYSRKPMDEAARAVLTSAFAAQGSTLYSLLFGGRGNRFHLMAYDPDMLTAQELLAFPDNAYMPRLCLLADGSFLAPMDTVRVNEYCGLLHIAQRDGAWSVTQHPFAAPMGAVYPHDVQYSAKTGIALVLSQCNSVQRSTAHLLRVAPAEGFAGMDTFWSIPTLNAKAAVPQSAEQVVAGGAAAYIQRMALSPEGDRALLLCFDGWEMALLMLNLADMSLEGVSGISSEELRSMAPADNIYLAWQGNLVLIGPDAMQAQAYYLQ